MALDIYFDRVQFLERTCRACSRYFDNDGNDGKIQFCQIFEGVPTKMDEKTPGIDEPRPNHEIKEIYDDILIWKLNIKPCDGLPQQFCMECVARFRSVKLFREECLDTQKVLESYFKDFDNLLETVSNGKSSPKTESVKSDLRVPGSPSSLNGEYFLQDISKTSDAQQQLSPFGSPRVRFSPKLNDLMYSDSLTGTPPPLFEEIKTEPIDMQTMECMKAECELDVPLKTEEETEQDQEIYFKPVKKTPTQTFSNSDDESSTPTSDEEADNSSDTDCDSMPTFRHETSSHFDGHMPNPLQCKICLIKFSNRSQLKDHHTRVHPQEKPYTCEICASSFKSNFLLCQHKLRHNQLHSIKCEICSKYFRSQLHLQRHAKNFHLTSTYTCHICHNKFENYTQIRFQYHVRKHGEKRFHCQYCDKSFHQKIHLINHERTHTKEQPFQCNICGKAYRQQTACQEHMMTHQDPTPFKCKICLKGFTQRSSLRLHYRTHNINKPYQCEYCGQDFAQKVRYESHMRNHITTAGTVEGLMCEYCNLKFKKETSLQAHIQTAHLKKRLHTCVYCGKTFTMESALSTHMKTHVPDSTSPNFKCQYCDKSFQQEQLLILHEQQHNEEQQRFECSFCDETFIYRSSFGEHMLTHLASGTCVDELIDYNSTLQKINF